MAKSVKYVAAGDRCMYVRWGKGPVGYDYPSSKDARLDVRMHTDGADFAREFLGNTSASFRSAFFAALKQLTTLRESNFEEYVKKMVAK